MTQKAKSRLLAKKIISVMLVLCFAVSLIPSGLTASAATSANSSIKIGITGINGNSGVSGSYIYTSGTFTSVYWNVITATKNDSSYTVQNIYPEGTKSVSVPTGGILIATHTSNTSIDEALKVKAGYTIVLSNGINLTSGTVASGAYILASEGDLTLLPDSPLKIDYASKSVSNISEGTTVASLLTNFAQYTTNPAVKLLPASSAQVSL